MNISIYIKDKRKNGFGCVRPLNYVIETDVTHTKLKVWTRRRSVNHKMWGFIISFALNLDVSGKLRVFFEMYGSLQFCAAIFENCVLFRQIAPTPFFKPTGRGNKFKCGAKSAGSASFNYKSGIFWLVW